MGNVVVPHASWLEPLALFRKAQYSAGRTKSSVKLRDYHLRRFACEARVAPFEVTPDHLAEHLASHGWSRNTKRAVRATLRSFYGWAVTTDRIDRDPTRALGSITPDQGKPRPADDEALQAGLAAAGADVSLMIRLGAYAGLRCCEIAQVSADHVSRSPGGFSLRVRGKGEKVRVIPIPPALAHELLERRGIVFPGQIDGHLSAGYVSKRISAALPEGVTAHMLRHRFATRAYAGSKNLRAVQELLGHASVATTQVYTAVDDDELRRAASSAA